MAGGVRACGQERWPVCSLAPSGTHQRSPASAHQRSPALTLPSCVANARHAPAAAEHARRPRRVCSRAVDGESTAQLHAGLDRRLVVSIPLARLAPLETWRERRRGCLSIHKATAAAATRVRRIGGRQQLAASPHPAASLLVSRRPLDSARQQTRRLLAVTCRERAPRAVAARRRCALRCLAVRAGLCRQIPRVRLSREARSPDPFAALRECGHRAAKEACPRCCAARIQRRRTPARC